MRVSAINNYNTPLQFTGNKDNGDKSLKNAARAVVLATALSGVIPACDKLDINHHHKVDIPVDTVKVTELVPVPTPPQIIYVDREVPVRDTIFQKDSIPYYIKDVDTVWLDRVDTLWMPGKIDTLWYPKVDTLYLPGETIVQRDTITLPGETIYVKEDWESEVPPKQEELYDELGIETNGDGEFFLSTSYYDRKNSLLVQRHLNGQSSSRDGKTLVYNVIKTGWDHEAEGVTLGKNEKFEKHLVYLSDDKHSLGVKILKPKSDVNVSNEDGKSNWTVFTKGALSTPASWQDADMFYLVPKDGFVEMSNGFTLKPGMTPQSVTKTNSYGSEWELKDWNVIRGEAD